MRRISSMLVVTAILTAGVVSFVAGRVMGSRRAEAAELGDWLRSAPTDVRQADRRFEKQAERLMAAAGSQRTQLSALLSEASTTDRQIIEQADRMIESNTALVKAVAGHVVSLGSNLPQPQRRNLMNSCAGSMRGQYQWRYRYRGGAQGQAGWRGRGPGRGPTWRYRTDSTAGQCFVRQLRLTADQATQAQRQDPSFNNDAADLVQKLDQAQAALLAGFESAQTSGEELLERADAVATARSDLEKRVARHIALIHAFLTPPQRQTLAQLVGMRGIDAGATGG